MLHVDTAQRSIISCGYSSKCFVHLILTFESQANEQNALQTALGSKSHDVSSSKQSSSLVQADTGSARSARSEGTATPHRAQQNAVRLPQHARVSAVAAATAASRKQLPGVRNYASAAARAKRAQQETGAVPQLVAKSQHSAAHEGAAEHCSVPPALPHETQQHHEQTSTARAPAQAMTAGAHAAGKAPGPPGGYASKLNPQLQSPGSPESKSMGLSATNGGAQASLESSASPAALPPDQSTSAPLMLGQVRNDASSGTSAGDVANGIQPGLLSAPDSIGAARKVTAKQPQGAPVSHAQLAQSDSDGDHWQPQDAPVSRAQLAQTGSNADHLQLGASRLAAAAAAAPASPTAFASALPQDEAGASHASSSSATSKAEMLSDVTCASAGHAFAQAGSAPDAGAPQVIAATADCATRVPEAVNANSADKDQAQQPAAMQLAPLLSSQTHCTEAVADAHGSMPASDRVADVSVSASRGQAVNVTAGRHGLAHVATSGAAIGGVSSTLSLRADSGTASSAQLSPQSPQSPQSPGHQPGRFGPPEEGQVHVSATTAPVAILTAALQCKAAARRCLQGAHMLIVLTFL